MSLAGQTADWKYHLQSLPDEKHNYSSNEFCLRCHATKSLGSEAEIAPGLTACSV